MSCKNCGRSKSKERTVNSQTMEWIKENYPDTMKMDGFDDCIVGICERFGQESIIAYDKEKVIAKLMQDGMTEDEALEFFEYNQIGSWIGEQTPCFITSKNEN